MQSMLINVDENEKGRWSRSVGTTGLLHRASVNWRLSETLDDGSKATTREVIIILVSDPWRYASRKLKKGRENGKWRISYPTECSTVFDRGVAFTFRSHAQAYHPGKDIFTLALIPAVTLYPRLRVSSRCLHILYDGFFRFGEKGLNSGNVRTFFSSRVLMGEDSEARVNRTFTSYIAFASSVFTDFFFKTMFPTIIMFFTFLNCVKWREYLIMGFSALSVLMIVLGLSVTSFLTTLWNVGKNGVKARSSW